MSRHFCFCIPVRAGVFVLSFLTFCTGALFAGLGWFLFHIIETGDFARLETNMVESDKAPFEAGLKKYKWAVIVGSLIFTFIALISFFGFIGSIVRNRRMVKAYSFLTIIAFLLGSAAAGFLLYLVYSNKPFCLTVEGTKECVANNIKIGEKIGLTAAVVVEWLGQLYIVTIIRRYYQQLEEEREYRNDFRLNPTSGGTYEAKEGLLATQGAYPYSDQQNRFGSHA
ncbi:hypothetical protein C2E23DRAFT_387072 [Lenzites betulinus]|nr:hypothetical protein C2E23DRAFT_387072 [Lenzites betulinus]